MDTLIESIEYKTYTIEVHQDFDHDINPREWDNLGTIISKKLQNECRAVNANNREDVFRFIDRVKKDGGIVLEIHCYSHGIDRYRTRDFSDCPLPQGHLRFDTFLAGFIYVTLDKIREDFGVKRVTKKIRDRATKVLESEINELDLISSGQVYGYKLLDKNGDEIDSCWGYVGDSDSMVNEVKSGIDHKMQKAHTRQPVIELLGA